MEQCKDEVILTDNRNIIFELEDKECLNNYPYALEIYDDWRE